MSSTLTHPLLDAAATCRRALDQARSASTTFLSTDDKAALLRHYVDLENTIAALRMQLMAEAQDVAETTGARTVAQWLAHETHQLARHTTADLRLAEDLLRYEQLAAGVATGAVNGAQARVIVDALDLVRPEASPEILLKAEASMVEHAARLDPHQLKILGRHLLELVAPDEADALEAARLERQDENAQQHQRLTLTPRGDGMTQISGRLPDHVAIRLATYLHAFTNPRRFDGGVAGAADGVSGASGASGEGQALFGAPEGLAAMPYAHRAAVAFGELLEAWDPKRLPLHGGDATTLMVTVPLESLMVDLATANLLDVAPGDEREQITAGEARRLACNANLVAVVLGSDSEILDIGRGARLYQPPQRKAMALRDRTCVAEGCSTPAAWCEAHHWLPWSHGGLTDLADGSLLFSHHHHLVHDPLWRVERLDHGKVRFHRRR